MSAKTGKSISELREEMRKGAISSQMVTDAFMQATQAGGKFFGMTKEGAKTVRGAQAQLEGAIRDMLNEMGQSTEGFVKDAYGAAQGLVENWKEVGKAIAEVVGAFGLYKAALMAAIAYERIHKAVLAEAALQTRSAAMAGVQLSQAQAVAAARTNLLTLSLQRLKAAILANPFAAIAAAVIAAGYGIYKWVTYEDEATKAQNRMNEAVSEGAVAAAGETRALDDLLWKLESYKEESEEFKRVREEIFSKYGQYLTGLNKETTGVDELRKAYDGLTKSIRDSYAARAAQKFMEGETSAIDEEKTKLLTKLDEVLRGQGISPQQWGSIRDALLAGKDFGEEDIRYLTHMKLTPREKTSGLINEFKALTTREKELSADVSRRFGIDLSQLTPSAGTPPPTVTPPPPEDKKKKTTKDYEAAAKAAEKERVALLRNMEYAIAQAQIDGMKEGSAKVIAQNELDFKKETDSIAKQRENYLEILQKQERLAWEEKNPNWKDEGKKFTPLCEGASR
jgi:hypothetical protein